MDGVDTQADEEEEGAPSKNIMVLAATNRPWDLDEAMIRRLEKRIYIPLPEETGRKRLFEINSKNIKLDSKIVWDVLIKKSKGYSGADISNVCWEASLMPMRRLLDEGKIWVTDLPKYKDEMLDTAITQKDFEDALKNVQTSVSTKNLEQFKKWFSEFGSI
jgi:katanin p60 ATPase-containing subunit A1